MKVVLRKYNLLLRAFYEFQRYKHIRSLSSYSAYITLCSNKIVNINNYKLFYPNGLIFSYPSSVKCYKTFNVLCSKQQKRCGDGADEVDEKSESKQSISDADRLVENLTKKFEETFENENVDVEQSISVKETIAPSLQEQFKVFHDEDAKEILDIHEVQQEQLDSHVEQQLYEDEEEYSIYQQKRDKLSGLKFTRGETGVFDIEELVDVLNKENARDLCVIEVPEDLHYCDYLVLITAVSPRHLMALTEFIHRLYKRKKNEEDNFVNIEGKDSKEWQVIDMRNVVLHVFSAEMRRLYDLETLWTVGSEYDDLTVRPSTDKVYEEIVSHIEYLNWINPAEMQK